MTFNSYPVDVRDLPGTVTNHSFDGTMYTIAFNYEGQEHIKFLTSKELKLHWQHKLKWL